MSDVNELFVIASREKYRYGAYATEDLWDLPLTSRTKVSLDTIARDLNKQIKESAEESFVVKRSSASKELQQKFDIVKYVIDVRLAETEAKAQQAKRKAQKDKIKEMIAQKQDEDLQNKSIEELQAMLTE